MNQEEFGLIPLPDEQETPAESPISLTSQNSSQNESQSSTPEPTKIIKTSSKGIENAKKRLRAFSIQKKTPMLGAPALNKPAVTGSATVIIGKLSNTKQTLKPITKVDESKKIPKPPKPAQHWHQKTLSEIEDMKLKIELVELGIPLGLICPSQSVNITKAMPTKAMPPIKTFLEPDQINEIIKEAKQARAEGKVYKFDYNKLLPGYDNPFQKRKDDDKSDRDSDKRERSKSRFSRDRYDEDKYDRKFRRSDLRRGRSKERYKDKKDKDKKDDVILKDFVVCDSWSLDNDDKSTSSPKEDKNKESKTEPEQKDKEDETTKIDPMVVVKQNLAKQRLIQPDFQIPLPSPEPLPQIETLLEPPKKIEKLKPVSDSFTYEIDPKDEPMDIFDEDSDTEKFSKKNKNKIEDNISVSSKNTSIDDDNDEFLESIINDINRDNDDDYDKEKDSLRDISGSVTPELDESMRAPSLRSDYSEITLKSIESGYKSVESSFKSGESSRSSSSLKTYDEKEINQSLIDKMSSAAVDSLETWSFVLKICQPLLFRHDKNKCYRETKTRPRLWFADNPKCCDCVKDRAVVYEELELCKTDIIDAIYGSESIDPQPPSKSRGWYPRVTSTLVETNLVQPSSDWESDSPSTPGKAQTMQKQDKPPSEDVTLHKEYERFMDEVWPEIAEPARSPSTPVREEREGNKRKKEKESEGWSQESDVETQPKKIKADKDKKNKKRKLSGSSKDDDKKKRRLLKTKIAKKHKVILMKHRRLEKKYLKCLKNKQKKKAKKLKLKLEKLETEAGIEIEKTKKEEKKKLKLKKRQAKKKRERESSSSSSDSSDTDEKHKKKDVEKAKKKKKRDKKRKKRKQTTSESTQSEEQFDSEVLNNIKKEKLSDSEKMEFSTQDFSPRRAPHKPSAEIINMKELQNDFESTNMMVKQEDGGKAKIEVEVEVKAQEEIITKVPVKEISPSASVTQLPVQTNNQEQLPTLQSCKTTKPVPTPIQEQLQTQSIKTIQPVPTIKEQLQTQSVKTIQRVPTPIKEQLQTESIKTIQTVPTPVKEQIPTLQSSRTIQTVPTPTQEQLQTRSSKTTHQEQSQPLSSKITTQVTGPIHIQKQLQTRNSAEMEFYAKEDSNISDVGHQTEYNQDYELYEQMAMEYQNDVARKRQSCAGGPSVQRIETVVSGPRGQITCDWRPTAEDPAPPHRPSRWGLKPSEVNIVLTGPHSQLKKEAQVFPIRSVLEQNTSNSSYDEAYADVYAASDRLQYGDCFGDLPPHSQNTHSRGSLEDRINKVLTEVSKSNTEAEVAEKNKNRVKKRVSFADGFKPGQDSDSEKPPIKKRKVRVVGCAWPCPAEHPAHVPLWDCLPPPPPPPGSPPPYFIPHQLQSGLSLPSMLAVDPPNMMMMQTAN